MPPVRSPWFGGARWRSAAHRAARTACNGRTPPGSSLERPALEGPACLEPGMRLSFELFINRRTSVAAAFDFGDLFLLLRIGKMQIAIKPLPRAPPINTPEGGSLMSRTMRDRPFQSPVLKLSLIHI